MKNSIKESNTYLRDVTEDDIDILYEWVNEEAVRKSAFQTNLISYEEHKKWFAQLLNSLDCRQYIYMHSDEPIGEARITIVDGSVAEISYSICSAKRCLGYGRHLLQLLKRKVREEYPNIKKLVGKVKTDNVASQKTFMSAGYTEVYQVFELSVEEE